MGKMGHSCTCQTLALESRLNLSMKKLILNLCALAGIFYGEAVDAADKSKVVFISWKPSHGRLAHEHRAGNMLLAKALNDSGLPVEALVLKDIGYPKDKSVLDDADTIVIFCTGHGGHVLNEKLNEFDSLMKKGKGVYIVQIVENNYWTRKQNMKVDHVGLLFMNLYQMFLRQKQIII